MQKSDHLVDYISCPETSKRPLGQGEECVRNSKSTSTLKMKKKSRNQSQKISVLRSTNAHNRLAAYLDIRGSYSTHVLILCKFHQKNFLGHRSYANTTNLTLTEN